MKMRDSGKKRILVIDDEDSIRYTFGKFLSAEGYYVETASGPVEALALLSEDGHDLIFLDILLGNTSGLEILREIEKKGIGSPVVMITGYPEFETAGEAVRLGAFAYLAKPVKKDALLHVTRMALQHQEMVGKLEQYRANLEAIFMNVSEAIILLDGEACIQEMNPAARELFGVSGSVKGASVSDFCDTIIGKALTDTMTKKEPVEIRRFECRFFDRIRIVSLSTSPLFDSRKDLKGIVLVIRDETRVSELEEKLSGQRRRP